MHKASISSWMLVELCRLCSFSWQYSFQMSVLFALEMRNMYQTQGDVSFITGSQCPSVSPPKTDRYHTAVLLSVADTGVRNSHCGCECVSLLVQIKQSPPSPSSVIVFCLHTLEM